MAAEGAGAVCVCCVLCAVCCVLCAVCCVLGCTVGAMDQAPDLASCNAVHQWRAYAGQPGQRAALTAATDDMLVLMLQHCCGRCFQQTQVQFLPTARVLHS